ncbi:hypothetical protein [Acidiplasma sp.]|uniref:hypothetical protein n=1 Tax=Acidiplasma sp. TaxID=1872114 RepID=UPI00258C22E3|nr:hypothetical protein [Acidiplasma sp.]
MLGKVIKLILSTRFTVFFMLLIIIMIYVSIISSITGINFYLPEYRYVYILISAIFILLFSRPSRIPLMKSDIDFLYVSPIKKTDFALAIFISYYIVSGMMLLIFLLPFSVYTVSGIYGKAIAMADTVIFSFFAVASELISISMQKYKILIASIIILYIASTAIFGYGPLGFIFGHIYSGTLIIIASMIIAMYFSIKGLENYSDLSISGKSLESDNIGFYSKKGCMSILKKSYYMVYMRGGIVKNYNMFIFIPPGVIIAMLIFYFFIKIPDKGFLSEFIMILFILYLTIFSISMIQNTFMYERGWLSFNSVDPAVYMRYFLLGKVLRYYTIMIPSAVIFLLEYIFIGGIYYYVTIIILFNIPSMIIIGVLVLMRTNPRQIKDPEFIQIRNSIKNSVYMVLIIPFIIINLFILLSFYAVIISSSILFASGIYILLNKNLWRSAALKLFERGFI